MKRYIFSTVRACMLLALMVPLLGIMPPPPSPLALSNNAIRPPARLSANGSTRVVIELADAPTAVVYASIRDAADQTHAASMTRATRNATQAAVSQLRRVEAQQQRVLPELARLNATVLYRTQRVYNGIAVQADVAALAQIARLPGVKALHPLTSVRLLNSSSVPFIGAPQLWSSAAGLTGKTIRIGIIDTGIDYIHTDFGGSGLSLDYSRNDTAVITETPALFPTAKVAGGYDFVGDNYDSISDDPARNMPHPDPDPMDCNGHGSHVAGTAAGIGVKADGTTYTGPYSSTLDFSQFKIGPGVAPQASLYALRIFGCGGSASSDVVSQAIEYSVDPNGDGDFSDRMDVINMSLGASGGGSLDTQSVASDNAAKAGVVVVASAGNDGDAYYIGGSPGNADRVISVAATGETTPDTLADFSSRGPSSPSSHLKPDIAAPGLSIFSAANGTGSEGRTLSGTSMAAPHIAGAMALLKQQHPTWTVEELKALAMNTAIHDVRSAPDASATPYGPGRVGAGRVDLPNAAAQGVIAYNGDGSGTVSVSFGALEITETTTLVKQITVANKGSATASYSLAYQPVVTIPGVSYSIAPAQVTLLPSQSIEVQVTLTADPTTMQHTHDPSVPETQNGIPRHWLSEATGHMTMTAQGDSAATGRLPIYAAARPASQMHAVQQTLPFTNTTTPTGTITLSGTGLLGTNVPTDELSIVTAYELAYVSPQNTPTIAGRNADLRYVGVASGFKASGAVSDTMLFFGLATFRDWASPHQVEFEILIDANRDGIDDYALVEWNYSNANGATASDVFVTVVVNPKTGQRLSTRTWFVNGLPASPLDAQTPGLNSVPFNTNVMMLPVAAADIGLSDASSTFNYRIRTYSTDLNDAEFQGDLVLYGNPVEETPYLSYDAAKPGLDLANHELLNAPIYPDLPTTTIPFAYNNAAFTGANSRGMLLFHHHNTEGNRVDVVADTREHIRLALPLIVK